MLDETLKMLLNELSSWVESWSEYQIEAHCNQVKSFLYARTEFPCLRLAYPSMHAEVLVSMTSFYLSNTQIQFIEMQIVIPSSMQIFSSILHFYQRQVTVSMQSGKHLFTRLMEM